MSLSVSNRGQVDAEKGTGLELTARQISGRSIETKIIVPIMVKLIESRRMSTRQSYFQEEGASSRRLTTPSDQPQSNDVVNDELFEIRARFLESVQ